MNKETYIKDYLRSEVGIESEIYTSIYIVRKQCLIIGDMCCNGLLMGRYITSVLLKFMQCLIHDHILIN